MGIWGVPKRVPKWVPLVRHESVLETPIFGKMGHFPSFYRLKISENGSFCPFLAQKGVKKGSGTPKRVKNVIFEKTRFLVFLGYPQNTTF